ncbi:MAG TPA: hypothetical protein VHC19_06205 [Pirellulales bacterium]|jgi:hypothetical protein|nr:hypothetical protein [Pirellulales bacterium]
MSIAKRFAVLGLLGVAWAAACASESSAARPNSFKPNDEFIVSARSAPLMRGHSTLATLKQGQRLRVLQVEGPWVGTAVTQNGNKVGGWVWAGQAATPQQYSAMRRSAARRYSFAPTPSYSYGGGYNYRSGSLENYGTRGVLPNQESPNRLRMGDTSYGRSYWRADRKIMGY